MYRPGVGTGGRVTDHDLAVVAIVASTVNAVSSIMRTVWEYEKRRYRRKKYERG